MIFMIILIHTNRLSKCVDLITFYRVETCKNTCQCSYFDIMIRANEWHSAMVFKISSDWFFDWLIG